MQVVHTFYHDFVAPRSLCLSSLSEQSTLWHQQLGHAILHLLHKLEKKNLVRGLPSIKPLDMTSCAECLKGKKTRSSFPSKQVVSTNGPLDLIHMDLCGPMRFQIKGGNRYIFVLVDDFTCFTWTIFLKSKDQGFTHFSSFVKLYHYLKTHARPN